MTSKSGINLEFNQFCTRTKHLRQILRDTQKCFKDINDAGSLNGNQFLSVEFPESEESELENLTRKPPGVVILGPNNHAKALVVNEILGKCILPMSHTSQTDSRPSHASVSQGKTESPTESHWRTVRLRFGKKQRVSYCLANSFELLGEAMEGPQKPWATVPLETLEAKTEVKVKTAEVKVNNQGDSLPKDSDSGSESEDRLSGDDYVEIDSPNEDHSHDQLDIVEHCNKCSENQAPGQKRSDNRESPHGQGKVKLRKESNAQDKKMKDINRNSLVLEVTLNHPLLNDGAQIIVAQTTDGCGACCVERVLDMSMKDLVPVFVYAMMEEHFTDEEMTQLRKLKSLQPSIAVLFVQVPKQPLPASSFSMKPIKKIRSAVEKYETEQGHPIMRNSVIQNTTTNEHTNVARNRAVSSAQTSLQLFQQLLELGYLNILPCDIHTSNRDRQESDSDSADFYITESELIENFDNFPLNFVTFTHQVLQCHLVKIISLLHIVHTRCLQTFIMSAFDMARDMMITPKRIHFAKEKESELYNSLMDMAMRKQDEIKKIIAETIEGMRESLIEKASTYDFIGVQVPSTGEVMSSRDLKTCTSQIQDLVLGNLNSAVANKLLGSVDILKDSYTGVLTRCLESLEQSDVESKEVTRTSLALREILTSAYQVEITIRAGASIVKVLLEKMKQLVHTMPWKPAPRIDSEWKQRVAEDMLNSLSENRLAKSICRQIKERLKHSHESFSLALKQLEARHSGRLERTEALRVRVRKDHAPKVARLALESTSFKDMVAYGMPNQGREIGRGQYGVVYACDSWSGYHPCAIKSVVPPDDKHWNDLAMEFFYTKNVPDHDRVVSLRGSVIDYTYGGGSPAVLLIMDRLEKDLYTAIRGGLGWPDRLQVAIDVVEGIRYLHSQGLVHRDIKLKNVLLDKDNRGKLTDLGFCKPEAMMSGSIVGTPIHMAPELFSGSYDSTVDVYAFGILFWYVCAGHVRLPYNFEQCTNKEMLWTSVRRGVRPERLVQFDDPCWELMQACWHGEPNKRPLLGFVEPKLAVILDRVRNQKTSSKSKTKGSARQS